LEGNYGSLPRMKHRYFHAVQSAKDWTFGFVLANLSVWNPSCRAEYVS
jgi:hypothetical protein